MMKPKHLLLSGSAGPTVHVVVHDHAVGQLSVLLEVVSQRLRGGQVRKPAEEQLGACVRWAYEAGRLAAELFAGCFCERSAFFFLNVYSNLERGIYRLADFKSGLARSPEACLASAGRENRSCREKLRRETSEPPAPVSGLLLLLVHRRQGSAFKYIFVIV